MIDHTHDPATLSWIEAANGHPDFPLQNLPFGVFSTDGGAPRCGVAIGNSILDLCLFAEQGRLPENLAAAVGASSLNRLIGLGRERQRLLRHVVFDALRLGGDRVTETADALHAAADCVLHLPCRVGDYTDFYAGIVHATNVGSLLRPETPLLPNYKHIPIGYHGRSSTIRISGTPVRRPRGQIKPGEGDPVFKPTARLDYETELALWIGAGSELGEPIELRDAELHLAGVSLLNDWSARDVQAWEYQPLGPFLAKNFATTVSPWLVTMEALAPFRTEQAQRAQGDPPLLGYLCDPEDQGRGALSIDIEVSLRTRAMIDGGLPAHKVGRTSAQHLYWTAGQMVAHHTSNGCNLRPGDLLGTGTISSPDREGFGSLMEVCAGGKEPMTLPNGEQRTFLEDGDEVVMRGRCERSGFVSIGLGECRAVVLPALTD